MKDRKAILKRLKAGDTEAFDAIYNIYSGKLYTFSFCLLKDHDLAEERVQDIFVTLWEKRELINVDLNFENYIYTICFNSIRKYFRRKKIEKKVNEYMLNNSPEGIPETYHTVIYNELFDLMEGAIEKMPEKRKAVYKMSRQEGRKIKEIATKMDISHRTVEAHLAKAMKFIRQELEKASILSL
jgi:RNA polymerase sigma-70 factor (family 1)